MQPVKKQIKGFVSLYSVNEEYRRRIDILTRVSKSEEWRIVIELLWSIKNKMAIELLQSSKYTKDDEQSKDVTQKVYHNIAEWIDFLTQPANWIAKKGQIQLLKQKLEGVKPERKENQHGRK